MDLSNRLTYLRDVSANMLQDRKKEACWKTCPRGLCIGSLLCYERLGGDWEEEIDTVNQLGSLERFPVLLRSVDSDIRSKVIDLY